VPLPAISDRFSTASASISSTAAWERDGLFFDHLPQNLVRMVCGGAGAATRTYGSMSGM